MLESLKEMWEDYTQACKHSLILGIFMTIMGTFLLVAISVVVVVLLGGLLSASASSLLMLFVAISVFVGVPLAAKLGYLDI